MCFTRHGCTSGPGLWRKRLTSTRIPRAFFCSTCPANNVSSALNSSSVIEEVDSFQSTPMIRVRLSQKTLKNLSSCSCVVCIVVSLHLSISSSTSQKMYADRLPRSPLLARKYPCARIQILGSLAFRRANMTCALVPPFILWPFLQRVKDASLGVRILLENSGQGREGDGGVGSAARIPSKRERERA